MSNDYEIPLSTVFEVVATSTGEANLFRVQLLVNGYQFGKYGQSTL